MLFSQLSISHFLTDHGSLPLSSGGSKKGTLILTGTLGSLRTNSQFASYGASRSGARSLAQALGKEFSAVGVHVVHTIVNGGVRDEVEWEEQRVGTVIGAETLGREYLHLAGQGVDCWTSELDLRPAQEKF